MEEQAPAPAAKPSRRAPWILGAMIVASAVVRSLLAVQHASPTLFPDEYIYAAIGRAIGHGSLDVRGGLIHFPEIFEPLLAAPIWRLFSVTTAYHAVQIENSVLVSFAAIPVYLLARSLRLSETYSLFCSAYALVLPETVRVAFTSSDAVGYVLAQAVFCAAIAAIDDPTRRRQLSFLGLATLATLTRVEYFAVVPAYAVAAVAVDGRAALRRHRVSLAALAPVAVVGALAVAGYYEVGSIAWHGVGSWLLLQPLLLAIEAGVVIVPGAVAALLAPVGRRERAFAVFAGSVFVIILVEATKVAADTDRYAERYLFALSTLVPVAFGLYLRNGRPRRLVVWAVALLIAFGLAREPLSGFLDAVNSEFVTALIGTGHKPVSSQAALVIALLATAGAAAAVVVSLRGGLSAPIASALAAAVAITAVATRNDIDNARAVRAASRKDVAWIDHATHGPVTLIETPVSTGHDVVYQLYWNSSIDRELLLGTAHPSDLAFKTFPLDVGPTGTLENVPGDFVFHRYGTSAVFANAKLLDAYGPFTVWKQEGRARLRAAIEGRYFDGWMGAYVLLRAWPDRSNAPVTVTFTISLPRTRRDTVKLALGSTALTMHPGDSHNVSCGTARGPLSVVLRALSGGIRLRDQVRAISVKLTRIAVADSAPRASSERACTVLR